ncbi:MAG TPA: LCP family protein [Anaerolineae bacterium]
MTKKRSTSLAWLNRLLEVTIAVAFFTAASLIYLIVDLVYHQPLHPVAAAAEVTPAAAATGVLQAATPRVTESALLLEPKSEASSNHSGTEIVLQVESLHAGTVTPPKNEPENGASRSARDMANDAQQDGASTLLAEDDRITVLLMGVDSRLGYSIVSRTDMMMLISVDPNRNAISLLSIPRDLYVWVPGHGRDRINTAFVLGSDRDNPAGGAALAMETVESTLGVPIDHYALVDFSTLIRIINTLGGIDVDVPYTINDPTYPDMNYGYDPLYIPKGLHHFDGNMALKYARTRHQDNDFYRAQRQQQIVFAVRRKVMSLGVVDLIKRAPLLYERVRSGVFTDLSLAEIVRIVRVASDIPGENIHADVLDYDYVVDHRTREGASVLIPVQRKVTPLIQRMFYEASKEQEPQSK